MSRRTRTRLLMLLGCCLLAGCCCMLAGCGFFHENDFASETQDVQSKLASASVLDQDEVFRRAREEMDGGMVTVYSTTSITEEVVANFVKKYPSFAGKVVFRELDDESAYSELVSSIENGGSGADMLISHSDLMSVLANDSGAYSYFPAAYKYLVDSEYQMPSAFMFSSTLFVYDSSNGQMSLGNVWELTQPEWRGRILMKDPRDEQVNMDFFCMLESPEWAERLKSAYKAYYGYDWQAGEYDSISLEWTAGFIANCDFSAGSSSDIMQELAGGDGASGRIALVGYSKLRKLTDEERARIGVFSLQGDVNCFGGFAFGTYATVVHDTAYPYTCALLINYILSEEGFSGEGAWNNYNGYYSTNSSVGKDIANDHPFDFWEEKLVVEDPNYLGYQNEEIQQFVERCAAAVSGN